MPPFDRAMSPSTSGPSGSLRAGSALLLAMALSFVPLQGQATLEPGQRLDGSLSAADTVRYTLDVGEDWFVFGEVDQVSVDVRVRVLNPQGNAIGSFDDLARGGERFSGLPDDAGTYVVELTSVGEQSGDYSVVIHRAEPRATDPDALVDQIMSRYDGDDTPGVAVRVWRGGETVFSRAYGMANLAYDVPFRTDTRTNIGSTSKQFTAFAVLLQAERGLLSLDDDIRTHIPELPEFDHPITVRHLITHTSGLREFLNLLVMSGRRLDRGDWIGRDELIDIVQRQTVLQNEPGGEWNYNNTAFGLAAAIVERTSGLPFHEFMHQNVFEPLGMTRTMVRPSPLHVVPEASEGYTPDGESYLQIGDLGGAVGAGGIYSTVEDLQKWVENFHEPTVGTPAMFEAMMTPFELNDGESTGYGYGLSIDEQRGLVRISHGGADVAHRSQLIYFPEIDAGLTTQSNHAGFNSGVAARLAEAFFGDAMEPEEVVAEDDGEGEDFDPESYDPEAFDGFVGRYSMDVAPDFILSFFREGDTLFTQATGQQRIEIVPTSETTFALTVVEASVTFHRDDDGAVSGLTLHQNGDNHATRLEDEDGASGWSPTAEDLRAFEGRYFSDELETYYTIAMEDDALVARQRRMDDIELSTDRRDVFAGNSLTFTFERDGDGQVTRFRLSNVRTRDVVFERVP